MSRIERTNEKYQRAFAKRLHSLDQEEPEASFDNIGDMLKWLDEPTEHDRKSKAR